MSVGSSNSSFGRKLLPEPSARNKKKTQGVRMDPQYRRLGKVSNRKGAIPLPAAIQMSGFDGEVGRRNEGVGREKQVTKSPCFSSSK